MRRGGAGTIDAERTLTMVNRFCLSGSCNRAPVEKGDAGDPAELHEFSRLSGDEIERMIALCEAPALLWRNEPAPAREPEPFGMIA
jgi:hypothetical protein